MGKAGRTVGTTLKRRKRPAAVRCNQILRRPSDRENKGITGIIPGKVADGEGVKPDSIGFSSARFTAYRFVRISKL